MADVFQQLVDDQEFRRQQAGQLLLTTLAQQAGSAGKRRISTRYLRRSNTLPEADVPLAGQLVRGLSEGVARQGGSLERTLAGRSGGRIREVLAKLVTDAQATARDDDQAPAEARVPAIQMLALGAAADAMPLLTALVDSRQPQEVQMAAITAPGAH